MPTTPPTFVQEAPDTLYTQTNATSRATSNFNVLAGDVLAGFAFGEDNSATGALGVSGGGLVWTPRGVVAVNGFCGVGLWTAPVAADATIAATLTKGSSANSAFGGNAFTFRGSAGIGAQATPANTTGAPSVNITTTGDNSAIVVAVADWNALSTARTWRTVNGITPSAGNGMERTYNASAQFTVYGAYYSDAGAAGTKTVGLTAPTGQKYSIVAVEILGTGGGGGGGGGIVMPLVEMIRRLWRR